MGIATVEGCNENEDDNDERLTWNQRSLAVNKFCHASCRNKYSWKFVGYS